MKDFNYYLQIITEGKGGTKHPTVTMRITSRRKAPSTENLTNYTTIEKKEKEITLNALYYFNKAFMKFKSNILLHLDKDITFDFKKYNEEFTSQTKPENIIKIRDSFFETKDIYGVYIKIFKSIENKQSLNQLSPLEQNHVLVRLIYLFDQDINIVKKIKNIPNETTKINISNETIKINILDEITKKITDEMTRNVIENFKNKTYLSLDAIKNYR